MIKPQAMLIIMAWDRSKIRTGIIKVEAKISFEKKVENVEAQTSRWLLLRSDSSETWIPRASEKESAIAMLKIPPKTTAREPVPELSPTIIPRVVIVPEVRPKQKPLIADVFIVF